MLYHASGETHNLTDESFHLITRVKNGDMEAFGLIFEEHHRFIFKFIYAMLSDFRLAEELTQETFLGAYKGIHALRGEAKLQTWLCSIAKNLVYKSLRSSRNERAGRSGDEIESLNMADDRNAAPDRQFLNKELNYLIYTALKTLDDDKRLVFTLKELQNLSYKEISDITGSAIPKLKTDLHRAKAEMRVILGPYMEVKNEL